MEIEIVDGSFPAAGFSKLYGADGEELIPDAGGVYTLDADDIDSFALLPPLHWSTPVQGDVVLQTTTYVTDRLGDYVSTTLTPFNISIHVTGVADKPGSKSATVVEREDEEYLFGPSLGSLTEVLVDVSGLVRTWL